MKDFFEEVHGMAKQLGKPDKPLWYDVYGCPHWEEPREEIKKFIRKIKCQECGQVFDVCPVHPVYRNYGDYGAVDKLPGEWHYGDPPCHPRNPEDWKTNNWFKKGWMIVCGGVTMNSIPEWDEGFKDE